MKIKSLKLKDFRNYELLQLDVDNSTNIFYGNNAQGKTNILEAIYLSGTTKSHRGTKDKDEVLQMYLQDTFDENASRKKRKRIRALPKLLFGRKNYKNRASDR